MKPITRTAALRSAGIAVLAVTSLLLAACSGGATSTGSGSSGSTGNSGTSAAFGSPSPALIKAAQKEGTVTWYTTVPPAPNAAVAAAFTKEYGIKVVVNRGTTSVLEPLFNAETSSGKIVGDVIEIGTPGVIEGWADQGLLVQQSAQTLGVLPTWPTKWNDKDTVFLQAVAVYGLSYNTDLVKTPPKSWKDLLKPQYKGKIIMTDPRTQIGGLNLITYLEKAYGDGFLKELGQQDLKFSGSLFSDSIAAGDDNIGFPAIAWSDSADISKGAPLADTFPSPSLSGSEQWAAQIKGSPHPKAAELLLNYLLSKNGQEVECKGQCSSVVSAPGTIPFPKDYVSPLPSFSAAEKTRLLGLIGLKG